MDSFKLHGLTITLFLTISLAACSTPKGGGLIGDMGALESGRFVDKSQVEPTVTSPTNLSSITLVGIDTSRVSDQKGFTKEEGATWLRAAILPAFSSPEVIKLTGSGSVGQLELAIVEMSTGNAIARVFAGELGAGHAWVQVDARVVDSDSGQLMAELSDRRRGSGIIGIRDTFGSSGPAMVHEMLVIIGRDLRRELEELFLAR